MRPRELRPSAGGTCCLGNTEGRWPARRRLRLWRICRFFCGVLLGLGGQLRFQFGHALCPLSDPARLHSCADGRTQNRKARDQADQDAHALQVSCPAGQKDLSKHA